MKRSRRFVYITAAFVMILTAATAGRFAGPPTYDLSWHTIDGGGETFSTGGSLELSGTIGQPDAGPATPMTGGDFSLTGGFWPGAPDPRIKTCPPDIAPQPNGDGLVNVDDLLLVINSWGPCPSCPADITPIPNGDDAVNVDDLLAVINAWGPCP